MTIKAKVLVIGGGPAGATAAAMLSNAGIETVLLEKNFSFCKPCGGGVPSVAFKEFQIPPTQIRKEVDTVKLISPSGDSVEIDISPDKIIIVDRNAFDCYLRESAKKAGSEIIEGQFLGIERDGNYYLSKIQQAAGELVCRSEYIIAADGVNSKVRLSQGIRPNAAFFTISERIPDTAADKCEFWFSAEHAPGFYSWIFPAPEGISIGTGAADGRIVRALLEVFKRRTGIQGEGPDSGRRTRMFKIPQWKGDLYNKGNIIFVGDSAGQVMPLSYEGIYYAMKSGACAAEAILGGSADLYKKIWENRFRSAFWFCSRLNQYFLKNDRNSERLVSLHKRDGVKQVARNLWLTKNSEARTIHNYIKILGKLFI